MVVVRPVRRSRNAGGKFRVTRFVVMDLPTKPIGVFAIPPENVLVICTRRIGDVLLATALARTLKSAWPSARIDALVFEETQYALADNPDISRVLTVSERPGMASHFRLMLSLWRRYNLAVSTLPSDRATLYAWAAGRYRIGVMEMDRRPFWKEAMLDATVPYDDLNTHTVAMNLRLAGLLGLPLVAEVVVSCSDAAARRAREAFPAMSSDMPFAVMHVSPKFAYKAWTAAGWTELAKWVIQRGIRVVVTGGATPQERTYVEALMQTMPAGTMNLAGQLDLPALACVLSRACLYVGTDTAVTHMAAALGVPTVALFGPSNPVKWGPWPKGFSHYSSSPWALRGTQRVGNVLLLQGEAHCVPCREEGCERHLSSSSDCLQHLPARRAIEAASTLLNGEHHATHA